ncbi:MULTISPECIES: putative bifunctional diguanylate cyclase/phosphodiesterase [unclassified Modestobacter]|uniref:putative bifunctional diguanylate cyclase/phosphodiesterase n=1 Tax=unclassified Modestobacter TaxID=2643866 RepID=UPI0022AB2BC1|nr:MULTISPECIES: EAL domain-containing protein [unclassified Modestobacter]MCZ2824024.1 EAL domain-containing protein [Modestobacter sp. VKM Ac-2981]MCZ2852269.1 EAL domain-containing protein [Modestobacter sp. VKM Ac-2982]
MQQTRRWRTRGWLLAVPVLTGAAGGAAPLAADLLLFAVALVTAGLLWRTGGRGSGGLRGWRLLALAVLLGLGTSLLAGLLTDPPAEGRFDATGQLVQLPAALLALVAVLTLLSPGRLRRGGARLATETALFFCASLVLAQVLVVGPAMRTQPLEGADRVVLEVACLVTASVLSAVLLLIAASPGPRRGAGALLLLAAATWATTHGLAIAGEDLQLAALGGAAPAGELVSLLLLCLAALRDPGAHDEAPPTRASARINVVGQLLPHLVTVAAGVAYLGAPLLGAAPSPAATIALLSCLSLTAVHRAAAARDEHRVAARLRRSEAYFRSLVRSSSDAVLILDGDLRISWVAPAVEPAGSPGLRGRSLPEVVHPEDAVEVAAWLTGEGSGGVVLGLCSFRLADRTGAWRVFEAGVTDLRGDADVAALVLHCRDVTARLDRELELRSLAFVDPLTGLPNRAAQRLALAELLAGEDDGPTDAALLLVELHGLRAALENAGSEVVETTLTEVARRLRATVRGEDQVARIGTELFSVLAHGTGDELDRLAARCLAAIEAPIVTDAGIVDLSGAVGLVPLDPGLSEGQAVDRAELAVVAARAAGTGSVRRYRSELSAARDRREQLREDLVGARDRGELALAWQPIVALDDQRVTGVEALLRWQHPVYGEVPPEEFLPVAERAGLVVDLQRWVLREATAAALTLPRSGVALKLAVNVSAAHLAAGTLVGDVTAALRDSGLPPERLVVEIAESSLEVGALADDVAALRLMGVRLALDDFGSGRSSLPALGRLPIDIIKLDRSLLSRVDRDPYSRAVCQAVVALAATLGIDVVAEGVETTSQLTALRALGCGYAQGFLLARPIGLAGLVQLLESDTGRLWPGVAGRVGAS